MKNTGIILIIIIINLILNTYVNSAENIQGLVDISRVIDGDTIEIVLPENKALVRLIGIDCYETTNIYRAYKQAHDNNLKIEDVIILGKKAHNKLSEIIKISNNTIVFKLEGIDKYGRLLGTIFDLQNKNINILLEKEGYCNSYIYE